MTALIAFFKALITTLGAFFSGECVGELKQAKEQSEEDTSALVKADNNAGAVDTMSDNDISLYLNSKHGLRNPPGDVKPD